MLCLLTDGLVLAQLRRQRRRDAGRRAVAEAGVGNAAKLPRDVRKFVCEDVVVSAAGEFGCGAGAAVALIEIATAGDEFKIFNERAVEFATRAVLALAATKAIARSQPAD